MHYKNDRRPKRRYIRNPYKSTGHIMLVGILSISIAGLTLFTSLAKGTNDAETETHIHKSVVATQSASPKLTAGVSSIIYSTIATAVLHETPVVQSSINEEVPTESESTEEKMDESTEDTESSVYPKFTYSKDWDANDSYLLAKIAMAEAEGENTQTKTLIILCVLNRVWSDEFPNSIHDVIYQKNSNGTYQFSPIGDGRWDSVEPNEDCWEAVDVVMRSEYDYSGGALYFEACEGSSWHSRNLQYLYTSGSVNFYK